MVQKQDSVSEFEDNPNITLMAALSDTSMNQEDLMRMILNEENVQREAVRRNSHRK